MDASKLFACCFLLLLYILIAILYISVPGTIVKGYVTHELTGKKLVYRLNGLRVFIVTICIFVCAVRLGLIPADIMYLYRYEYMIAANIVSILISVALFLRGNPWADATSSNHNRLTPFFVGAERNPQWGLFDLKMFFYVVGGTTLMLNIFSFAAHSYLHGHLSVDHCVYVFLFAFFLLDYFYHEQVHLYTFDFLVEKVGMKITWGCLFVYPFIYNIISFAFIATTTHQSKPNTLSIFTLAVAILVFFVGWILSRGANNQKFLFKTQPTKRFLNRLTPQAIGGKLLCNGFWGLSRHVNYAGEILMAVGLALCCPANWLSWIYPVYYILLLTDRQRLDDKRCYEKYGPLWKSYCYEVPYRIIPYVY
eukprot:GILK01013267.1.p1 GENE.GILK01013267.1~~GILK01013267.1.p1  ORF type:complete len:379 (+),score=24.98 GILK01013267.1:44-1138(+)